MKRYLLMSISLLLFANIYLFAQETDEDSLLPPKHTRVGKIGGGLGFTPTILFMNVDPINSILTKSNAADLNSGPMMLYGGQGYGYVLLVENLRVGGIGLGGSKSSAAWDPNTNTRRDINYHVGYGGVTIEYAWSLTPRLDITPGIMLGAGGVEIKMTKNIIDTKNWNDLWNEYGSNDPTPEYSRTLTGSFFVYQPSVNVEYALLRWVGLRVGVSYLGMTGGSWKMDGNYDIVNVPSDINGHGFMINTGVFVGTFLF